MRNEEARNAELRADAAQVGDDLVAERVVERRERLIHHEQARVCEHGAAQCYALFFAAGELAHAATDQMPQIEHLDDRLWPDTPFRRAAALVAVEQVRLDAEVRKERRLLEHD